MNKLNELLLRIQDEINSQPCKHCGKYHKVSLSAAGAQASPMLTYDFSDDACEVFQDSVKAYVAYQLGKLGYPVTVL